MIDTLTITTKDFEYNHLINVMSDHPLSQDYRTIKNGQEEIQPLILTDVTGKSFYGQSLNLKGDTLRGTGVFTISNLNGSPSLSFRCSVPKFITGNNFYLATKGELARFFNDVGNEFSSFGVNLNPLNCNVSRVDCTRNAEIEHPFYQYIPMMRQLNCSRDRKSEINTETYTVGNNSRVVCCYDKVAEELSNLKSGEKLPYGLTEHSNIFRCESRLLNTDTVNRASKGQIKTCADLLKNYDLLSEMYQENLKKRLFKQDAKMLSNKSCVDTDSIFKSICCKADLSVKQIVKLFVDTCIGQATKDCLGSISVDTCVQVYKDSLDTSLISEENTRQKVSRFRKALEEYLFYWLNITKTNYDIPMADLYNELYEKLLIA